MIKFKNERGGSSNYGLGLCMYTCNVITYNALCDNWLIHA
jgi:hypothetical protein